MRTRLFSLILALFAVLLPNAVWAQEQAFITMKVNNGKVFDANDATYDLIYDYGIKPTSDLMEGDNVVGKYYDYGQTNAWTGWVNDGSVSPGWVPSNYKRANKVTYAELSDAFIANYHPSSCASMFIGCTRITSIKNIEYLKTDQAISLERMFHYCSNLRSLDLSRWDVSACEKASHLFRDCSKLENLDVSTWNTSNLQNAAAIFYGCISIQSFNIKNWNVSNFRNFDQLFYNCCSLKELDLSTWSNDKATALSSLFGLLNNLEVLDLSNFNTSKVTNISMLFQGCTKLRTIYVGEGWDMSSVPENGNISQNFYGDWGNSYKNVFRYCTSLIGGNGTTYAQYSSACQANPNMAQAIPNENFPNSQPSAGERVNLSIENLNYCRPDGGPSAPGLLTSTKAFAVVYTDGNGVKTLYLCNRGASEVKTTSFKPAVAEGEAEVEYTSGLTVIDNLSTMGDNKWNLHALLTEAGVNVADIDHVVIEPTFAYMRPTTCESWFSGMSNATFEGLENLNTTECTSMKDMFRGTSISSLDFSTADLKLTFKTSKVTDMSGMFADMAHLTSVTLASNFSTANVTTMKDMFSGCSSLTDIGTLSEYINT
ncbi:MAG: BspA family leucine-rich repeat surface protein, partial [Bacteroidaceae bacterium]|nr:BspA family leucine-rich repeat surface protein [Bacteroidaceae bacterium]